MCKNSTEIRSCMQYYKKPIFAKGRIVKKESLDLLNEFPEKLISTTWNSFSDGILYGCAIEYTAQTLIVCEGACIYQGEVVLIEREEIPFLDFDRQVVVKLVFHDWEKTEDFMIRPVELKIDDTVFSANYEMELGRFFLSKGAELRKQYQTMEDCRTAYNTLDVTHVPYAGHNHGTLSPVVFKLYARLLLESSFLDEIDYSFCFLCLNQERMERETVLTYFSCVLGKPCWEFTNNQIYETLVQFVRHRAEKKVKQVTRIRKEPKVL